MTTCPVDHPRIWTAVILAVILVSGAFLYFTSLDAHIRFIMSEPTGYLTAADTDEADLVFTEEQIEFKNAVSRNSLGHRYTAHERLFCMELSDDEVVDVRVADTIDDSDFYSISGGCTHEFGMLGSDLGLSHTHPGYNDELSTKDRKIGPPFQVTCIQYDEILKVRGEVYGLRCFEVPEEDGGPEREFPELELAIVPR